MLGLIEREAEHARAGRPARIVAKMNALVDADVIEALYRASQAGVQITLLVRGICCLRPGVPGGERDDRGRARSSTASSSTRASSSSRTAARTTSTSRSADWMPRNFHRRVEVMVPMEDPVARGRLQEILTVQTNDTMKSWRLQSDGSYVRVHPKAGQLPVRGQQRFIEMTRDKVKVADAAARPSTRFHLAPHPAGFDTAQRASRRARRPRKM